MMLRRNRSGEVTDLRFRLTPLDLLAFLLTGLLVLAMVGLSGAESWDKTVAMAKKEGKLVVVLGGGSEESSWPRTDSGDAQGGGTGLSRS